MPTPLRTIEADRDLLEIWVYIAEKSFDAADRLLDTINAKCQMLAESPGMGRIREDLLRTSQLPRRQLRYLLSSC